MKSKSKQNTMVAEQHELKSVRTPVPLCRQSQGLHTSGLCLSSTPGGEALGIPGSPTGSSALRGRCCGHLPEGAAPPGPADQLDGTWSQYQRSRMPTVAEGTADAW